MPLTPLDALEQGSITRQGIKTVDVDLRVAAGDQTLVAAVTGKRIVVWSLTLVSNDAANTIQLFSGPSTGGDGALTGAMNCFTNLQFSMRVTDDIPLCWTEAGSALVLETTVSGVTAPVAGILVYSEV